MFTPKRSNPSEVKSRRAWALYRLQSIPPSKLATVINRILRGDDYLFNSIEREAK
ncbi:MAG: hypothetical protein GWO41_17125 [candidate division Zixibacteria bacterium]|nr:hypothetical protein [candidate division Zixibacteria bacterium]NIS18141.1 hypothetical protein [candidate division Zixibacteria bacterium]NIT54415.1 hypothetical protein [candidate division Zixibacteria bacterium]NIW42920.1 hypothetical protein [candidate division Zixibacteria bacterium]NIX80967.1 hypothetical protein [candidate division Zixibacteria bacterium]